jgi:hypothetical protein
MIDEFDVLIGSSSSTAVYKKDRVYNAIVYRITRKRIIEANIGVLEEIINFLEDIENHSFEVCF